MRGNDKIFYTAIGNVIKKRRKDLKLTFTVFCYENDIAKSTLDNIERANRRVGMFYILQVAQALGLSIVEFAKLLQDELPKDFKFEKEQN